MTRRTFAFWIGFGLFHLGEKLRGDNFDRLAATVMRAAGTPTTNASERRASPSPVHWTADEDETWRWYERESWIDGAWTQTGMTTPIHKRTGERKSERGGYLDDNLLPKEIRPPVTADEAPAPVRLQLPTATRRSRHGRPPSKWLRSLEAAELRIWLTTIEPHEAGVSGMTYFDHLTRDHSFDAQKITGLTDDELAKLHGAAHFGY
jgi:hypothetical protein